MFATPGVYMQMGRASTDTQPAPKHATVAVQDSQASQTTESAAASTRKLGIPRSLKTLLALNPMTGVIGSFRAATLGRPIPWGQLGTSSAVIALLLAVGCLYFRKVEDGFADII